MTDSAGGTITRTYDGFDRLTQEQTPEGTVSYSYDAVGRRATMTVTGQPSVVYTWDNANRLTQIAQGTDVVAFTYDNANRRASTTLANGVLIAYGYDDANELTSIAYSKGGTAIGDLTYAYDAAGQRTSVGGSLAATDLPAAMASAAYNANNQLTSWAGSALTYDLNGNLTADATNTYTWNARDELAAISGGSTASFVYDATGRRRSKTTNGAQTGFLYDGRNFVQELNGASVTANLVTGGIDEFFARKESTTANYPVTNELGSVIGLTDVSGALQTQYSYEPYGKATRSGTGTNNSQTYTGREDDGTGLAYNRARYYNPTFGRFIGEDPIGLAGGSNFYAYVGEDPILKTDRLGLLCDVLCQNANQAAGLPPGGSQPPDGNMSLGLGYLGQWGHGGESRELGIAANMKDGKLCFYTQVCKTDALGYCGSVGINVGLQSGSLKTGGSNQGSAFAAGGSGVGANISLSKDADGNVGGVKGLPRPGVVLGAAAGFAQCHTEYICSSD